MMNFCNLLSSQFIEKTRFLFFFLDVSDKLNFADRVASFLRFDLLEKHNDAQVRKKDEQSAFWRLFEVLGATGNGSFAAVVLCFQ